MNSATLAERIIVLPVFTVFIFMLHHTVISLTVFIHNCSTQSPHYKKCLCIHVLRKFKINKISQSCIKKENEKKKKEEEEILLLKLQTRTMTGPTNILQKRNRKKHFGIQSCLLLANFLNFMQP